MIRFGFITIWLALAISAVSAMFYITFEVDKLETRLYEVNRQIVREHEAFHVLQAEWSYLNRPQRLEALSREFLPDLKPVTSVQFTNFARLPTTQQEPKNSNDTFAMPTQSLNQTMGGKSR